MMRKKAVIVGLAFLLLMEMPACSMDQTSLSSVDEAGLVETPASAEGKQVRMTSGEVEVLITLNDSKAAADFVRMLPLELTLIERNDFAKGMTLPRNLVTDEETTREYEIGDFGYWDAGPDLAIFYDDIYEQTIVPVVPMGKAESGAENMRNTSGTVRLELISDDENRAKNG